VKLHRMLSYKLNVFGLLPCYKLFGCSKDIAICV
jgi:hypothetical protein